MLNNQKIPFFITVIAISVLSLISILLTYESQKNTLLEELFLNNSYELRSIRQNTILYRQTKDQEFKEEILKSTRNLEDIYLTISTQGTIRISNDSLRLNKNGDIDADINLLYNHFNVFKYHIRRFIQHQSKENLSPSDSAYFQLNESYEYILDNCFKIVYNNNFLGQELQKTYGSKTSSNFLYSLVIWMLISLGLYFITTLQNRDDKKMKELTQYIHLISEGEDETPIPKEYTNKHQKNIIKSLKKINTTNQRNTLFTQSIVQQKYNDNIVLQSDDDHMSNNLIKIKEKLQKVDRDKEIDLWSKEGIQEINDLLKNFNKTDPNTLIKNFIGYMCKYVGINQGGFFKLDKNEEPHLLKLQLSFGYDKIKLKNHNSFSKGEGLVGQCADLGKPIIISNIPEDYCSITSSIGEFKPKIIILSPVNFNNTTYGILELVSIKELEPHHISFIQNSIERLASTISVIQLNEDTKSLTDKTTKINNLLHENEIKLKTNIELLEEKDNDFANTISVLKTTQLINEHLISSINTSTYTLTLDPQQKIINANYNICNKIGYQLEELKGRKHSFLFSEKDSNSQKQKDIWEKLKLGVIQSGEFLWVNNLKNAIWVTGKYNPMLNENNELVEVTFIATKISEHTSSDFILKENTISLDNIFPGIKVNQNMKLSYINNEFIRKYTSPEDRKNDLFLSDLIERLKMNKGTELTKIINELFKSPQSNRHHIDIKMSYLGKSIFQNLTITPELNNNTKNKSVIIIFRNITEQKIHDQITQKLLETHKKQSTKYLEEKNKLQLKIGAYSNISLTFETDKETRFTAANNKFYLLLGYINSIELSRKSLAGITKNIDRKKFLKEIWISVTKTGYFEKRIELIKADNTTIWVDLTISPIIDNNYQITGLLGTIIDATEKVLHDNRLKEIQDKFKNQTKIIAQNNHNKQKSLEVLYTNILEQTASNNRPLIENDLLPTMIINNENNIINVNDIGSTFLNTKRETLIGKHISSLLKFSENSVRKKYLAELGENIVIRTTLVVKPHQKEKQEVETMTIPLFKDNQKIIFIHQL